MNYLTTQQYATLTGIKYKTVLSWYKKGRFDAQMIKGIVQIKHTEANLSLANTFGDNPKKHNSGRKFQGVEITCGLEGCIEKKQIAKSRVMKINFCSPEHFKEYQKGEKWWDEEFTRTQSFENAPRWKGYDTTYRGIHKLVTYHKGVAIKCSDCGNTKEDGVFIEWSNQSGMYLRDLNDYIERCQPCHKKYDKANGFTRKQYFDDKGNRITLPPQQFL